MKINPVQENILRTASTLFYQNGYNRTGINEIIREAGIAKATLYHHYKSKEDIFIAYLRSQHTQFDRDIQRFVMNYPVGPERLTALFDYLLQFYSSAEFNGCWCINSIAEVSRDNQRVYGEIQRQKNDLIQFIKSLILETKATISEIEAKALARQIYVLYEGAVAESNLQKEKWPIESARSLCQQIVT